MIAEGQGASEEVDTGLWPFLVIKGGGEAGEGGSSSVAFISTGINAFTERTERVQERRERERPLHSSISFQGL